MNNLSAATVKTASVQVNGRIYKDMFAAVVLKMKLGSLDSMNAIQKGDKGHS